MGLLQGLIEAIHGSDNAIAGRALTQLAADIAATSTGPLDVTSTLGFGEWTDGMGDAMLLINGELIYAAGRTDTSFTVLTRGYANTAPQDLRAGAKVLDFAENSSARDLVRRGLLVNFAVGDDLDVIGRNLGLHKCDGLPDTIWREVIKRVAFVPKQTLAAFHHAMLALFQPGSYQVYERVISDPFKVFLQVHEPNATSLKGRFFLNGGEPAVTNGLTTVVVSETVNNVLGVYLANDIATTRYGMRRGTNYYAGSFSGSTINLSPSPGPIGTAVIVDYGAFTGHYLPPDVDSWPAVMSATPALPADLLGADFYPYFTDQLALALCVVSQVRAAGVAAVSGST